MKKTISTFAVAAIIVAFTNVIASADIVNLGSSRFGVDIWGEVDYKFTMTDENGDRVTSTGTAGPIFANSATANFVAPQMLYCGDIHTSDSPAFSSAAGQAFQIFDLASIYGEVKAAMIQTLVDHTAYAFADSNGIFNENYSIALQLAIWEVLEEPIGADLNLGTGLLVGTADKTWNTTGICIELANDILSSLQTGVWGESFTNTISREIFVFASVDSEGNVNRDISQTMIGFDAPPSAATPEPGTMLIFGVGLAGAALARRRTKKA